jgi:XTP/dITP diphosphohydrolase
VRPTQAPAGRRILVATRSRHKLGELRSLLHLKDTELVALDDVGITEEPDEDAATFRGNAVLKARYYAERSGLPTLADDSGLEVDALGGSPGVRTRRYASENATDDENNAKLLAELGDLPLERRTARYRCVLAFLDPRATSRAAPRRRRPWVVTRSGTFRGRIAKTPRGANGFGYDPIFEPVTEPPGGRTVGQLSPQEKNRVSHRAQAARAMARHLRTWRDPA